MENNEQKNADTMIEETKDVADTKQDNTPVHVNQEVSKVELAEKSSLEIEHAENIPVETSTKDMETPDNEKSSQETETQLNHNIEPVEINMASEVVPIQSSLVKEEPSDIDMDSSERLSDFPTEPRIDLQSEKATSITEQVAAEQAIESKAVLQINNSALALISQYISSDSESNITDSDEEQPKLKSHTRSNSTSSSSSDSEVQMIPNTNLYRLQDVPVLVSDTEASVTGREELSSEDEASEDEITAAPIKSKGEMLPSELPPIEDLQISVPEAECKPIGHVESIVAQIVIVQSYAGVELLNLDTVLFLEKGKRALGKIFDVIGQITAPMYCVLFNNRQDVVSRGISVGMPVYCAPQTEHTSFIILSDLMKHRGSDASWLDDNEAPDYVLDYSDDEQERNARKRRGSCSSSGRNTPDVGHTSYQPYQNHHNQRRGYGRRGFGYRGRHGPSWHTNLPVQRQTQRFINPFAFANGVPPPPPPENNQ